MDYQVRKIGLTYLMVGIIYMILIGTLSGQAPEVMWFKTYGGVYLDEGISVQLTADDELIIAGFTYASANGGSDVYVIKTDSEGQVIWEKYIGGEADDWAGYISQTSDGGFIIAGGTESFDVRNSDVYLVKIAPNGQVLWQRTYGGANSEQAAYVLQTEDDGFLLVGWTDSFGAGEEDIYILRTSSFGDSLWARTYGDIFYDKGFSARQTSDGGFIIVGGLGYFGFYPANAYLIKIDENGDSLWANIIGGSAADAGRSIAETTDGGYIFAGWTMSYGAGQHDVYLVKVNSAGEQLWSKAYGGESTDVGRSIYPTSDNGYIIAGYTYSFDVDGQDLYLIKADYKGDTLWTTTFGGEDDDYGWSAIESADGGYVAVGWSRTFSLGSKDVLMVKYEPDHLVGINGNDDRLPYGFALYQNYPNPFNSSTMISYSVQRRQHAVFKIHDLLGREIETLINGVLEPGLYNIIYDGRDLASGVYLYTLQSGNRSQTRRMVLVK